MADPLVIDTHVHTYPSSSIGLQAMSGQPRVPGHTGTIDEVLSLMSKAGIARAAMVNFTPVADMMDAARSKMPADMPASQRAGAEEDLRQAMVSRVIRRNEWSCQVAREHPQLLAFIGVDPVMPGKTQEQEVEDKKPKGATGLKLHQMGQRSGLNDRRLWPAYRAAEALGMPIIAHSGPFEGNDFDYCRPRLVADVLRDFPKLTFILAHCGGKPYFRDSIKLAREFPGVNFDCCGVVTRDQGVNLSGPELAALFRDLGMTRVTYGSDWPFINPVPGIETVMALPISREDKQLILADNARRLLKL